MRCPICDTENLPEARTCASCGSSLSATDSVGGAPYTPFLTKGLRLQGGNYAVGEVLGQGGFGITYKGGDLSLRRYVAIKEFFPAGCAREDATVQPGGTLSATDYAGVKAKFIDEARTLARFSSPGIVRVYSVFEENNTAYMVMEFLEGVTLAKRISDSGPLAEAEAVGMMQKLGSALQAVHEAGLIHRDLKPDNICLTGDGRVVLIDFGTARSFASGKTVRQTTMLTPGYAPLEQYGQQARFGAFTDIYALAATFYHAVTGQLPPPATDRAAGVALRDPRELKPELSPAFSEALVRAMQIKADARPQSIKEFLDILATKTTAPAPIAPIPQTSAAPLPLGWGVDATPKTVAFPANNFPQVENWYHAVGGHQTGPMARDVMQRLVQNGVVKADTPIWREGMAGWVPTRDSEWAPELPSGQTSNRPSYPNPGKGYQADYVPIGQRPDTWFDKFMGAVPGWIWSVVGIAILLLGAARINLAVVRYQNGSRDFGAQLSSKVMSDPKAAPLSSATLQLGEGVFDDATATKRHDDYVGTVRYKDGDVGTLNLNVDTRDYWYEPKTFSFTFAPTDFGDLIGGQIVGEVNQQLRDRGARLHVTDMSMHRDTRTHYVGRFLIQNSNLDAHTVDAKVTSFNDDGSPATWDYKVD